MAYSPELGGLIYQVASMARREGGFSFAGGYPDPSLFDTEGLAQAFNRMFGDTFRVALQYGEREGYPPLRARLAAFSSTPAVPIAPEEVTVINGGQQGLEMAVRVLLQPGDTVLLDSPVFPTALQLFHLAGVRCVSVRADADGVDPDHLEAMAREHRPKMVYLVPSYSNPGGTLLSRERRRRVLELAVAHGFHVLEDEPYARIHFDEPPPPSLLALTAEVPGSREWLVHVSSLSKLIAPGLRVGWIIPPPAIARRFVLMKQATDIHSALPTQHALEHYWVSGRFEAHLPAIRASYRERALAMAQALRDELGERVRFVWPRGGMFIWCQMRHRIDARELLDTARREKVFFVPGVAFYPDQPDTATFRLSFATTPAQDMPEGIRRLGRVLAAHGA
jgi:DNA-binding transcriptional MocR family regulator